MGCRGCPGNAALRGRWKTVSAPTRTSQPRVAPVALDAIAVSEAIKGGRASLLALEPWVTSWPTSALRSRLLAQMRVTRQLLTLCEQQVIASET